MNRTEKRDATRTSLEKSERMVYGECEDMILFFN